VAAAPERQWQFRLGREAVWFGNFEREGATPWLLNQSGESIVGPGRAGERSLCQTRAAGQSAITTGFERRVLCLSDSAEHTVHGWVRTENSRNAGVRVKSYSDRTGVAPLDSAATATLSGTNDWRFVSAEFDPPNYTGFFDIELRSEAPLIGGTGRAWFDDVGIVEWGAWQPLTAPVAVTEPNDWYWVQLRTAESTATAEFQYDEAVYDYVVGIAGPGRTPARPTLRVVGNPGPSPIIQFAQGRAGDARLRIYDCTGRLVRTLSPGTRPLAPEPSVMWDGRDDAGRAVAAGLYFCRLETAGGSAGVKLVLVR
jgi:hypothetical protein